MYTHTLQHWLTAMCPVLTAVFLLSRVNNHEARMTRWLHWAYNLLVILTCIQMWKTKTLFPSLYCDVILGFFSGVVMNSLTLVSTRLFQWWAEGGPNQSARSVYAIRNDSKVKLAFLITVLYTIPFPSEGPGFEKEKSLRYLFLFTYRFRCFRSS